MPARRAGRRPETGRGASGQAGAARSPASAAAADSPAWPRPSTTGPVTTGPGPKWSLIRAATSVSSSSRPRTTTSWSACTPTRTSLRSDRAVRRTAACGSSTPPGVAPTTTTTGVLVAQPSAAARPDSSSDRSPRTSASTTSASSRASHAPRFSAKLAYTCAVAKATSRLNWRTATCSASSSPGFGHRGDVVLQDVDDDLDQVDGLLEGDHPDELARGGAEDVAGQPRRLARVAAPLHEGGDPVLGDQGDPGAPVGRHGAEPGELVVHPGHGTRGQGSRRALQPPERGLRRRAVAHPTRHLLSVSRGARSGRVRR